MAKRKEKNGINDDDANIVVIYMKEINNIPLLSREQENLYAVESAEGNKESREKLINANLRFVVNVAKKYQNQGLPLMDLISEGNIGLMDATKRYDATRGYHFISYAVWWVRQSILKALCEKSRLIKLPLNKANELVKIEKVRKQLSEEYGHTPNPREIADFLNMDVKDVSELLHISQKQTSLESPVYFERETRLLKDKIEGEKYLNPEQELMLNYLKDEINNVLKTISPKEAQVIECRFGLNGKKPMKLKQIAEQFNLSKERIRQIEKKALKRLRHPSRIKGLEELFYD